MESGGPPPSCSELPSIHSCAPLSQNLSLFIRKEGDDNMAGNVLSFQFFVSRSVCCGCDSQRVYREAEEMAKAFRDTHHVQESNSVEYGFNQDWSDFVEEEKPIANWDWLDFGGK
jgi:hypothetical protein